MSDSENPESVPTKYHVICKADKDKVSLYKETIAWSFVTQLGGELTLVSVSGLTTHVGLNLGEMMMAGVRKGREGVRDEMG